MKRIYLLLILSLITMPLMAKSKRELGTNELNVDREAYFKDVEAWHLEYEELDDEKCIQIAESDLPLTIDEPGTYCFAEDLYWNQHGFAITVRASNVCILGNKHILAVRNQNGAGIRVYDAYNFMLDNASVIYQNPNFYSNTPALFLSHVKHAHISNFYVREMNLGIKIEASQHIKVDGLDYITPVDFNESATLDEYQAVRFVGRGSSDIFLTCMHVFNSPSAIGSMTETPGFGLLVRDSHFNDMHYGGIDLNNWQSVVIEKCFFDYNLENTRDDLDGPALIMVGRLQPCKNIMIRDCKGIGRNRGDKGFPFFIFFHDVIGATVSKCSYKNEGKPCPAYKLRIADQSAQEIENVKIVNSIALGGTVAVSSVGSPTKSIKGLTISDVQFNSDVARVGLLVELVDTALLTNNKMMTRNDLAPQEQLAAIGLFGSKNVILLENALGPWPIGPGIYFDQTSTENLAKDNCLNVTARIVDEGSDNETADNVIVNPVSLEGEMVEKVHVSYKNALEKVI